MSTRFESLQIRERPKGEMARAVDQKMETSAGFAVEREGSHELGSAQYYDDRFESGYMESWPDWKRRRVADLVRSLPLPESGVALDFGCGNGVFTEVLIEALPNWSIWGTDISPSAPRRARSTVPGATFFPLGDAARSGCKVDLLFTHHVLEHVIDLDDTLNRVDEFLGEHAAVLHILPCGNPGSFEHRLCALRHDGFECERGIASSSRSRVT